MIKIYFRSIKDKKLNALDTYRRGSWIHCVCPDEREIGSILSLTGADESLVRDALDEYEVPRLETDKKLIYVFTRVPVKRDGETRTSPLMAAIGNDFILTIAREKCDSLESIFHGRKDLFTTQKTKLLLAIMSSVCRQYGGYLMDINKSVRGLRVKLGRVNVGDIAKFVDLEKVLNEFLSALMPTNTALENIMKRGKLPYYESEMESVNDLSVDFEQQIELTKSILKHVVNIRDAYSSLMTHDLNRVIKILTCLTILLTVPTMIFSFFGMNIGLPFGASPQAYIYITVSTVAVSAILFSVFIRNRWL